MSNTPNDLIKMTLQELGVLDTGQQISSEDAELVESYIPGTLQSLNKRDVGYITLHDLGDEIIIPLAQILAYQCYNAFNITDPTRIAALREKGGIKGLAEQTIKDIKRLRSTRQTMRVENFGRSRYGRWGGNY